MATMQQPIGSIRPEGEPPSRRLAGWQPIETAPKDGSPIDLWVSNGVQGWREADAIWFGGRWYEAGSNFEYIPDQFTISHWMRVDPPSGTE